MIGLGSDKKSAPKLFCISLTNIFEIHQDELGEVHTDDKSLRIFYFLLNFSCFILQLMMLAKSDEFSEKVPKRGGWVIFNPKIYMADFGPL